MKNNIISAIILIFNLYLQSNAESIIEKIEINPLNRTMIYLSEKPDAFNAELSPSKEKIALRLENTKTKNITNIYGSTGIIKNITVNSFKNFSEVLVEMSGKRGFTLNYLPYSKSIMLEVFDWNKLTKEEDFYRLGLLSYNDGLLKEAEHYFRNSASKDIPNAYFFLGLINMTKGKNLEALDNFQSAEKFNCNIIDNSAGLSEAFRLVQNSKKSNLYRAKFQEKTGINEIDALFNAELSQFDNKVENFEPTFLSSNLNLENSTSDIDSSTQIKIAPSDSIKNISKYEIIETPITSQSNNQTTNNLPDWVTNGVSYILLVLVLFVLLIISLYKKWRNEQILQQKKFNNQKFQENLNQARKNVANSKQMANIYQKYDKSSKQEQNNTVDNKENLSKPEPTKNVEKQVNEIELLAKSILSEKIKNETKVEDFKFDSDKTNNHSGMLKKLNPNLELALHLQHQNLQQKQKKLNDIDFDATEESVNLTDFAKKTGIDTGSLKAKKVIKKLLNDDEAKHSLSKKFLHQPAE